MSELKITTFPELVDYTHSWQDMRATIDDWQADSPDQVWLLEHPPVFTQGQAGKAEHVLMPGDIPVVQTDRGGQVTYHGPGQLMLYFMCDLRRKGIHIRKLVTQLEQTVIDLLASLNITAQRRDNAPGVYVDNKKICSIGLRVRKGKSYHGVALNVDMELEPFNRINPCGFQGLQMTQIRDFVPDVTIEQIKQQILTPFQQCFGYN